MSTECGLSGIDIPIRVDRSDFDCALEYLRDVRDMEGKESDAFQVLYKTLAKGPYSFSQVLPATIPADELVLRVELPPRFWNSYPH